MMIHIFFCASAAATFRQLLKARGIAEGVAFLSCDLDFGPISHGDIADREAWLDHHVPLDFGVHDGLARAETNFRRHVESDAERLVWIAPASAKEQAGLYWYLSQFGEADLKMAVADFPLGGNCAGQLVRNLTELSLESMEQLYDACPRMAWDSSRFPRDRWSALVAENAFLRVVKDGQLESAPDHYFDHYLLARCPDDWVKWHSVVTHTLGDLWETGQSAGGDLLLWRLRTLIGEGRIACDGELPVFGGSVSDAVKIRRAA